MKIYPINFLSKLLIIVKPEVTYRNFGTGEDIQHQDQRCTFALFSNNLPGENFGQEGKWYKEKCSKTKGSNFICKMNEKDFVKKCDKGWDLSNWGRDEMCLRSSSNSNILFIFS